MGGLVLEQLLGFLESLRLATAVLGGGSFGLVHPLHPAAPADPAGFGCSRLFLFSNPNRLAVVSHAPEMPGDGLVETPARPPGGVRSRRFG